MYTVMTVMSPNMIPGKLAMITGQSLCGFVQPYATHSVALTLATSGWSKETGVPEKLAIIWGMYEMYIEMHISVAIRPSRRRNRDILGALSPWLSVWMIKPSSLMTWLNSITQIDQACKPLEVMKALLIFPGKLILDIIK